MSGPTAIEEIIATLAATPGRLMTELSSAEPDRLARSPSPSEWSALQVLAHVRASDAIMSPRVIQLIGEGSDIALAVVDDRAFASTRLRAVTPIEVQLGAFALGRAEFVAVLRTLTAEEWSHSVLHPEYGRLTLRRICAEIGRHEGEHLLQIRAALSGEDAPTAAAMGELDEPALACPVDPPAVVAPGGSPLTSSAAVVDDDDPIACPVDSAPRR